MKAGPQSTISRRAPLLSSAALVWSTKSKPFEHRYRRSRMDTQRGQPHSRDTDAFVALFSGAKARSWKSWPYKVIPPDTETPGEESRGAVVVSDYGSVIGPQGTVSRRPDIDDFNPAAQHSNEMFHFNHD